MIQLVSPPSCGPGRRGAGHYSSSAVCHMQNHFVDYTMNMPGVCTTKYCGAKLHCALTHIPFFHAVEYMAKIPLLPPVDKCKQTTVPRIHGAE